jgi:hypothetical protein
VQQRTVSRLVRSSADFVLLPRSDDLLGVAGRDGGWPRALEQGSDARQAGPTAALVADGDTGRVPGREGTG